MKPDGRDLLVGIGILLLASGVGAFDWRIGSGIAGALLLGIGLFYKG